MAEQRTGVGRLGGILEEHGRRVLAGDEIQRANEKLRAQVLEHNDQGLSETKGSRPQSQGALGLSSEFGGLIAVVGLRGGSRVTGRLSARGLANVAVPDWSDDFTFIIGRHRYQCQSSVAQFLSPRVSKLHSIDATISELRLEVRDRQRVFGSVLEAARGDHIAVDSGHRRTFAAICAALWNSELSESVFGQLSDEVTMENVVDRLRSLPATQCDISTELEFIASHFYDLLRRRDALKALPFSLLYAIISRGSLRLESEDSLYDFIRKNTETNGGMCRLLEFVRLEYCSADVVTDFFDLHSGHFYEVNASMWGSIRTRLVLPNVTLKQFPPSVKKGKLRYSTTNKETDTTYDIPDGIIAHLTRECGGNVHFRRVVNVTCGSFEKEICGANPYSGAYENSPCYAARNAADLAVDSHFLSAYRRCSENIPHTRNNWLCYDFKTRRIVPSHYAIRTHGYGPRNCQLKSWLVDTTADGKSWRAVAHEEQNHQLNDSWWIGTFPVAGGEECRFIRLVQIGRNHSGDDSLNISAWEIFGGLFE
jgi:hypothetical protein